jgi:catechol 2,3-dioxygenase-like lactoylglutathione lyase family enzyme
MINGAHVVIYSRDEEADRAFFRDILGFACVDAGHGWLIFGLPAAESAIHPAEANDRHEMYLMCDDLKAEIEGLHAKGVECAGVLTGRAKPKATGASLPDWSARYPGAYARGARGTRGTSICPVLFWVDPQPLAMALRGSQRRVSRAALFRILGRML